MQVTLYDFCKAIAEDYNLILEKQVKKYFNSFPIVKEKRKISMPSDSTIVDKKGNEYPYMLSTYPIALRNNDKLIEFDYIYVMRCKFLDELCKEADIQLKSEGCRLDEGNGWYSQGTRYYYKDITVEI